MPDRMPETDSIEVVVLHCVFQFVTCRVLYIFQMHDLLLPERCGVVCYSNEKLGTSQSRLNLISGDLVQFIFASLFFIFFSTDTRCYFWQFCDLLHVCLVWRWPVRWFDMLDPLGRHGCHGLPRVAGVARPGPLREPLHSFGAQPVEPWGDPASDSKSDRYLQVGAALGRRESKTRKTFGYAVNAFNAFPRQSLGSHSSEKELDIWRMGTELLKKTRRLLKQHLHGSGWKSTLN